MAPFGAIPQQSTAKETIAAGSSATFTFSAKSNGRGADPLETTPQLLAGVRLGDISRVGFASKGATDWVLGNYEVRVNGQLLASKSATSAPKPGKKSKTAAKPAASQPRVSKAVPTKDNTAPKGSKKAGASDTKSGKKPAAAKPKTSADEATLKRELADLQALVQTGLATAADKKRLKEVQAALNALIAKRNGTSPKTSGKTKTPSTPPAAVDPYSAGQVQAATRLKRAALDTQLSTLGSEFQSLQSVSQLNLSTAKDQARAQELQTKLKALRAERDRWNRQLDGKFPWFIDPAFKSPWRGKNVIRSARITLTTDQHSGADTHNYVYFRTGGHKYLLGSPGVPLAGGTGPQVFTLLLDSGPLTTADLRGWSVGMLGSPLPYGKTPDRWHPKRIIVEIDDRIVYDSEENTTDRKSLAAIRLIPPAHYDKDGNLVVNKPIAREAFLWEAGKGEGLDLVKGDTLSLPKTTDPTYPKTEPGLAPTTPSAGQAADSTLFPGESTATTGAGASGLADSTGLGGWGPSAGGCGGFGAPGDYGNGWGSAGGYGSGWGSGFPGGGGWGSGLPGTGAGTIPGTGSGTIPGTGAGPIPGTLGTLPLPPVPPGKDPPPAGKPFQIESVRITSGWTTADKFTIDWETSGDESEIDFYNVALRVVRPETNQVFFANVLRAKAAAGTRTYTGALDQTVSVSQPYYFLAPVVTAVPKDATQTPHERIGPARAVFRPTSSLQPFVPLQLNSMFTATPKNTPPNMAVTLSAPVSYGGKPAGSKTAVWPSDNVEESHNAILFDSPRPAMTIAARPTPADDDLTLSLTAPSLQKGAYTLVAHLGYLGKTKTNSIATVEMTCRLQSVGSSTAKPLELKQKVTYASQSGSSPAPMTLLQQVIDTSKLSGGKEPFSLHVQFRVIGQAVDVIHPPALFGLRLLPGKPGAAASAGMTLKPGVILSPKAAIKTFSYQTFSNPNFPDLVCQVETGVYVSVIPASPGGQALYDMDDVHFLNAGRVKVTVENRGGKKSGPCRLGIASYAPVTAGKVAAASATAKPKGLAQQLVPPPAGVLPGTTGQKIKWIETEAVPPLEPLEKRDIYLKLPETLLQALGEDVSKQRYRVMVDMDNNFTVKEDDDPKGPGETNNWSNGFAIRKGPYIASFITKQSTLVANEKLQIWGRVYGSSKWDITYEYLSGKTSLKKTFDSDPVQQKPFPNTAAGAYITLPWQPWSLNAPEMQYPKVKVTLTAYDSAGTRKASSDVTLDLNDFDGTFQITDAKVFYLQQQGKVVGNFKVKYDCNKPFSVGNFGDSGYGSMYVRCQILNPDEPVIVWDKDPNSISINTSHLGIYGKSVYKAVHCVSPDAPKLKAQQAYPASLNPLPLQPLPAKGTFSVAWEANLGQTQLQTIARPWTIQDKAVVDYYEPVLRVELVIHTGKKQVSLKKRIDFSAPVGKTWTKGMRNVVAPDESLFLRNENWKW